MQSSDISRQTYINLIMTNFPSFGLRLRVFEVYILAVVLLFSFLSVYTRERESSCRWILFGHPHLFNYLKVGWIYAKQWVGSRIFTFNLNSRASKKKDRKKIELNSLIWVELMFNHNHSYVSLIRSENEKRYKGRYIAILHTHTLPHSRIASNISKINFTAESSIQQFFNDVCK